MPPDPDSVLRSLTARDGKSLPPVHLWNPSCTQDIDLRISRDGSWLYRGSPIERPGMVRLFSTILRRDEDGFFLVTPTEKVLVRVELAPFIAVKMETLDEPGGPAIAFQTNVGDVTVVDAEHPLWVEEDERGPLPFVRIRGGLDALLARSVFYELAESGTLSRCNGDEVLGVTSRGKFWVLGSITE